MLLICKSNLKHSVEFNWCTCTRSNIIFISNEHLIHSEVVILYISAAPGLQVVL